MRCGPKLALVCPHCGAHLPPGLATKFCLACGTQISAPPPAPSDTIPDRLQRLAPTQFAQRLLATRGQAPSERRIVTILVSDVKRSTATTEKLDPEELMEVMSGAFDLLIEPIARYEGTIARLMDDHILAFFGAPITHEDDAERACRAALEVIAGVEGYVARLEEDRDIPHFSVRVAIHTGLVVVGEVGTDLRVEYTAMGDAVKVASEMQAAAEPGTVLITEDTRRLIAPLFETQALEPIESTGRDEPVTVYQVLAPTGVAGKGRGIAGLASPLVGREAEIQALREALERLQVGVGGIITIVGEAGIGKSRLVAELRKEAAPLGVRWVEGRCLSYGESMAYLPWVDILHELLGVSVEDLHSEVRQVLRGFLEDLCPDHVDEVYPYVARMMSLPLEDEPDARLRGLDARTLKFLTFRAVERVVEAVASANPVVMVCEDLHWADASSLDLLEHLLSLTDRAPLLLVSVFRPYRDHGCWAIREIAARQYDHRYTDVRLNPLSPADSETLVGNLLHVEALPRPLRSRILEHAEGNPFYVEEVIRSLIDSELVVYDETTEQWQSTRRVDDITIPDTLQGVLTARIDRLEEDARRVLQMAAVIGRIFPYRVLAAISPAPTAASEEATLHQNLLVLQREEMTRERARVPEPEYIFKHHLTQAAAYSGLLRRERRHLHRQVAEALEELYPDRMEEQLGLLAHHWEQAGERERAIEYLRRAGEQAAAQFANEEAVSYFSRALDLAPQEDLNTRYALLLAREQVYHVQGARQAQGQDVAALLELAEALNDDARRVEVALLQGGWAQMIADYPTETVAFQTAVRLGDAVDDVGTQVMVYLQWSHLFWGQGDFEAARSKLEQAIELARAAHLRREEARCLSHLGPLLIYCWGDYAGGRAYYEQALSIYREIGGRRGEAMMRLNLGSTALAQGGYDEAKARSEEAMRVFREIGDRWHEGQAHHLSGRVYHELGEHDRARACYEQYLRNRRQLGHGHDEAIALGALARLSHDLGEGEAAREQVEQALQIVRDQGYLNIEGDILTTLGDALVGLGCLDEANDAYSQGLSLLREERHPGHTMATLAGLARVALAQGNPSEGQMHVEEILRYLETGNLDGVRQAVHVYLTCYRVLRANGDPRADAILEEGYQFLQERAAKISDEGERRSYLENVAANREIASEYALVRRVDE